MAKITLGGAPKTFSHKITFSLVSGGKSDMTVEYRYRNRTQFAAFINEIYPDLKDSPEIVFTDGIDVIENSKKAVERDVNYILAAVQGWNLEESFDAQNVKQLVEEFPSAANAIMAGYREACTEGKAKN